MSFRRFWSISVPVLVAVFGVGCGGYVTRAEYDRDVTALKKYTEDLEKEAQDLRKYRRAYDSLKDRITVDQAEAKMMDSLRTALLRALEGLNVQGGEVQYDPKTGKWTMAGDLLFGSGSFLVTPRGSEVLKKFAATYRKQNVTLRIVGHTDRDPIVKAGTKRSLHTNHNIELGALRACTVFLTLAKHGIPATHMFVESWGNNRPVAPNDSRAANKKKNRRVEIFVLGAKGVRGQSSR